MGLSVKKPINSILHVDINYNSFTEDYQKFLDEIDSNIIKKDLGIPDTDSVIFNGGWYRNFYYLTEKNVLCHSRIYIRKLNWTTPDGKNHYISLWPDFVIKYNPLSTDLIEYIATNMRKGEDIFFDYHIEDPECLLECEDLIHNFCQKVELACHINKFTAFLNADYTKKYNHPLKVKFDRRFLDNCRYPGIYLLQKTGQTYRGSSDMVLSFLNRKLKFLR